MVVVYWHVFNIRPGPVKLNLSHIHLLLVRTVDFVRGGTGDRCKRTEKTVLFDMFKAVFRS